MDYFVPLHSKGEVASLPVQFSAYRYNFLWPLDEQASLLQNVLHYGAALISLLAYTGTLIGEFTFLSENMGDLPAMTDCLSTTCMGLQYSIRIILFLKRQRKIRALFRRFFKEIYFTAADDPKLCNEIRNRMRVPDFFTKLYYIPMTLIYIEFLWDVFRTNMSDMDKRYIYRMSFHWYDAQEPLAYIITAVYTGWLCFSTVSLMSAEDFAICLILCHTSYRVKELQRHLSHMLEESRTAGYGIGGIKVDVHCTFRRKLYETFRQQQNLYSFINAAKTHFTYQVFYFLGFGVASLCVVLFQFQRTDIGPDWVKYIVWFISMVSQFLMIGYFGQMLMDVTSDMQQSYYMCHWEDLLPYGDANSNKALMRDISFAIENAQSPVVFDGMKFLSLTHGTVGAALRSALSYFMFLNTMNDANKSK